MAVKRKLTSPTDPVKGGSKAKKTAAKKPAAKKTTARKPKTAGTKTPTAKKAAAKKPAAKKTAAEKKFDGERATHLRKTKARAKGKSIEQRLKERQAKYAKGLKATQASQSRVRKLLLARQKVARSNLAAKQKAGYSNLIAKQKARLAARKANKPTIKAGKIVTPKVAPKAVTLKKPTLKPLPRLKGGKQTTAKAVHHKGTAAQKTGAKKAAKTKAKGKVTV
ncbi:hypothetical protein pEaSNUABM14_00191 [Erwinia phage pEa_SNUABM_14]|uniref:Uncharacterized protein n=1 Tax=Erwinia phage pEa_SNUABM_7 TaxID=2866695 RepID=A0AAE7WSL0_9CAUD|nr:hypothetical protein MPK74_gp192 [Erwinia phage pEa_SNUABM_7]QYW03151.1 hypothetical protein pEaSNUABM13_00192 [Erwinia phage pEa_SNUABM_13]QYW03492.1 hypothetical protein pEaSNUABM34_00190 [Erwinia phage pEa_SNUABM_34]QYW03834.1 hypothetical protein pEaSNUABM45_00191 [Erwinia phage pEa_SNUABM_45]QYW04175.1 hypothetical protein pEaSNUABM46_00191 [Erwinia phage pEa_SNUABM_46]QYW04516.1 hypothetical protein pEaSNUABM14_00191 [Erwinia phage pEa_SNUABM_14]